MIGSKIINLSFGMTIYVVGGTAIKRGCKLLLTVFRGTSLGMFWTPSAYKNNAYTHCWVQTSSIFIRGLALFLTPVYTP